MEFIPSAPVDVSRMVLFTACVFVVLGGIPLLATATEFAKTNFKKRLLGTLTVVVGGSALLTGFSIYLNGDPKAVARYEAVTESLDSYGLDLTKEERTALEYPSDRPDEDFEVFGSFTREGPTAEGFSRETVYLIWKDDLLHLASSPDGEQFTALEPRG